MRRHWRRRRGVVRLRSNHFVRAFAPLVSHSWLTGMVDEVEEFVALCASVLNDGEVAEDEAYQLADWLNHHESAAEHWPCDQLIEPLQAVWADGTANPQELDRLARVLINLQQDWARRHGAMATYNKSLAQAPALPGLPHATRPMPPPLRPRRRGWMLATVSVIILLVAAGFFAVREMRSAHEKPVTASSSPIATASPLPSPSTSLAPARRTPVQLSAKPATPSSAWTVITRQDVKTKAGKKEIVIPRGTTVKVIARSNRDLMISYKGESLTIPASATTSSR